MMALSNNFVILAVILTLTTLLGNHAVHSQFLWSSDVDATNLSSPVTFDVKDMTILVHESKSFNVVVKEPLGKTYTLTFVEQHAGLLHIEPRTLEISTNATINVLLVGQEPGSLVVSGELTPNDTISDDNLFIRIKVAHSTSIIIISSIIGWVYFVAWSVSFYPQIVINCKRKSVTGLSFDFLALNFMGHTLYAIFNVCLYWVPFIENQYFERHPKGLNPVLLNDVFFSIHASIITLVTIGQCFIYERGNQKVSYTAQGFLGIFSITIVVTCVLSIVEKMAWLDFLYTLSYIKLAITLLKYVPQAVLNYRRKSTQGWSIGNILLDFTGGILSMMQMIMNAYNFNDWVSIFGDPTKFGLGLFSVAFDILFIVQHYVLYRDEPKKVSKNSSEEDVKTVSIIVADK
ncbi:cystinosin homolog isoform X2 [Culicoides brevitarsis]|uniref:cystinosin homolog isoform X2 n=1 Tax=Culicoides brevitarsis TaxID=469753 RepID=UPI00307CBB87